MPSSNGSSHSEKTRDLITRVRHFIDTEIRPVEELFHEQLDKSPWETPPVMEELKAKAREQGLWNLFLPKEYGEYSAGLSNLEYAPLAEEMVISWPPGAVLCCF